MASQLVAGVLTSLSQASSRAWVCHGAPSAASNSAIQVGSEVRRMTKPADRSSRHGLSTIRSVRLTKRPDVTDLNKRPPDLQRKLEWLELTDCTCPNGWRPGGALYGVRMPDTWVRLKDAPDCPHHGIRPTEP